MNRSLIFAGLLAGISAMGVGVYMFYRRQIKAAMNYCYKITWVKINKVSKNDIDLDITVKVRNNSEFILNVTGYNLAVTINNAVVATINSSQPQTILNNGVSEIVMKVKFDPAKFWDETNILSLIVAATTNRRNFIIAVRGGISARMNFISVANIPISIATSLEDILTPKNTIVEDKSGSGVINGVLTDKCTI